MGLFRIKTPENKDRELKLRSRRSYMAAFKGRQQEINESGILTTMTQRGVFKFVFIKFACREKKRVRVVANVNETGR